MKYSLLIVASILFAQVALAQEYKHAHPQVLPTEQHIWNSCCHESDCMEAQRISVRNIDEKRAMVTVDNFPPFEMSRERVYPSMNGKAYFCRKNINEPPSSENIYCVFILIPFSV